MKKTFIALLMAMLLGSTCFGEALVIEIMEFDCTGHPDLYEEYSTAMMPKTNTETVGFSFVDTLSTKDKVLSEIEQVAEKTLFLNHSQKILIGEKVDLVTQLQDYEFKLKASTEAQDNDLINVTLDFSLSMGEYSSKGVNTEVTVKRGQMIPMGGGAQTQTVEGENGETKETKTVSVMRFTIK